MTCGDRLVTASAHDPHGPAAGARLAAVVAQSGSAHAAGIGVAVFVVIMAIVIVAIAIAGRHAGKWGPRSRSSVPPTKSQRAAAADEAAALRQGDPSNPDAPGNQQDDL